MSDITVAFLGPEHTYSHLAAAQLQAQPDLLQSYDTIDEVFVAIETRQARCGVVPIFNSSSGLVSDTVMAILRRLLANDPQRLTPPASGEWQSAIRPIAQLCISHSFWLPIQHCLVSWGSLPSIRLVSSKQQALDQCRQWLADHLPAASWRATESSTAALPDLAQNPTHAAIVSRWAAERLPAPLLIHGIQDQTENATEFVVVQLDCETKPILASALPVTIAPAGRESGQPMAGRAADPHGAEPSPTVADGSSRSTGDSTSEYWIAEWCDEFESTGGPLGDHWLWAGSLGVGPGLYWLGKRPTSHHLDPHQPWTLELEFRRPELAAGFRAWRLGASEP